MEDLQPSDPFPEPRVELFVIWSPELGVQTVQPPFHVCTRGKVHIPLVPEGDPWHGAGAVMDHVQERLLRQACCEAVWSIVALDLHIKKLHGRLDQEKARVGVIWPLKGS